MGGDGESFCHQRQLIHKKLGVLAQTGMTAPPELERRGAYSDRLRKAGTRENRLASTADKLRCPTKYPSIIKVRVRLRCAKN